MFKKISRDGISEIDSLSLFQRYLLIKEMKWLSNGDSIVMKKINIISRLANGNAIFTPLSSTTINNTRRRPVYSDLYNKIGVFLQNAGSYYPDIRDTCREHLLGNELKESLNKGVLYLNNPKDISDLLYFLDSNKQYVNIKLLCNVQNDMYTDDYNNYLLTSEFVRLVNGENISPLLTYNLDTSINTDTYFPNSSRKDGESEISSDFPLFIKQDSALLNSLQEFYKNGVFDTNIEQYKNTVNKYHFPYRTNNPFSSDRMFYNLRSNFYIPDEKTLNRLLNGDNPSLADGVSLYKHKNIPISTRYIRGNPNFDLTVSRGMSNADMIVCPDRNSLLENSKLIDVNLNHTHTDLSEKEQDEIDKICYEIDVLIKSLKKYNGEYSEIINSIGENISVKEILFNVFPTKLLKFVNSNFGITQKEIRLGLIQSVENINHISNVKENVLDNKMSLLEASLRDYYSADESVNDILSSDGFLDVKKYSYKYKNKHFYTFITADLPINQKKEILLKSVLSIIKEIDNAIDNLQPLFHPLLKSDDFFNDKKNQKLREECKSVFDHFFIKSKTSDRNFEASISPQTKKGALDAPIINIGKICYDYISIHDDSKIFELSDERNDLITSILIEHYPIVKNVINKFYTVNENTIRHNVEENVNKVLTGTDVDSISKVDYKPLSEHSNVEDIVKRQCSFYFRDGPIDEDIDLVNIDKGIFRAKGEPEHFYVETVRMLYSMPYHTMLGTIFEKVVQAKDVDVLKSFFRYVFLENNQGMFPEFIEDISEQIIADIIDKIELGAGSLGQTITVAINLHSVKTNLKNEELLGKPVDKSGQIIFTGPDVNAFSNFRRGVTSLFRFLNKNSHGTLYTFSNASSVDLPYEDISLRIELKDPLVYNYVTSSKFYESISWVNFAFRNNYISDYRDPTFESDHSLEDHHFFNVDYTESKYRAPKRALVSNKTSHNKKQYVDDFIKDLGEVDFKKVSFISQEDLLRQLYDDMEYDDLEGVFDLTSQSIDLDKDATILVLDFLSNFNTENNLFYHLFIRHFLVKAMITNSKEGIRDSYRGRYGEFSEIDVLKKLVSKKVEYRTYFDSIDNSIKNFIDGFAETCLTNEYYQDCLDDIGDICNHNLTGNSDTLKRRINAMLVNQCIFDNPQTCLNNIAFYLAVNKPFSSNEDVVIETNLEVFNHTDRGSLIHNIDIGPRNLISRAYMFFMNEAYDNFEIGTIFNNLSVKDENDHNLDNIKVKYSLLDGNDIEYKSKRESLSLRMFLESIEAAGLLLVLNKYSIENLNKEFLIDEFGNKFILDSIIQSLTIFEIVLKNINIDLYEENVVNISYEDEDIEKLSTANEPVTIPTNGLSMKEFLKIVYDKNNPKKTNSSEILVKKERALNLCKSLIKDLYFRKTGTKLSSIETIIDIDQIGCSEIVYKTTSDVVEID